MLSLADTARRLKVLAEHIGEVTDWPSWLLELATVALLTSKQRWVFVITLLGNRVPPILIVEHVLPMLRDASAIADVLKILRKAHTRKIPLNVMYWDVDYDETLHIACRVLRACPSRSSGSPRSRCSRALQREKSHSSEWRSGRSSADRSCDSPSSRSGGIVRVVAS